MRRLLLTCLLFAAVSLDAQPRITGISPDNAPAAGGTVVTITGTGFAICPGCPPTRTPQVRFGGAFGRNVTLVNETTLRVTVPTRLPARVDVMVEQYNGFSVLPNGFTFTGPVEEVFDRVLLPLFAGPIDGAFGSRFVTELRLANTSATETASIFGLTPLCVVTCLFPGPTEQAFTIDPGGSATPNAYDYTGTPGIFLYIPKSSPPVHANLRVYDSSRDAFNFGTEMPVVYDPALTIEPFKLLGVPLDPRFRNTLRIYATAETTVTVAYDDIVRVVPLRPGEDLLAPAYAQLSDIAGGSGTVDVTITPSPFAPSVPGHEPARVWAFVSVTNNETQTITTITPQR